MIPAMSSSNTRLRFIIFGGTGPSGICLIRKAVEVYPDSTVVIYTRSTHKIPADLAALEKAQVVEGNLDELDKVEGLFNQEDGSTDVVLSILGPPGLNGLTYNSKKPISKFYEHLLDIMFKHRVKRFIAVCTASHPDPRDRFSAITYMLITLVKTVAYNAYSEFLEVGHVVRKKGGEGESEGTDGDESKLDWTLVRVPTLTNGDKENVLAGYVGDGKVGHFLTRKAFAAFCIGEVEKREWVRKVPAICTP